ncbi:MAG: hypothetical protein ACREYF_00670 [Gammaproteobacteria bacterium]
MSELIPNEQPSSFDEIIKSLYAPQCLIRWDQVFVQIFGWLSFEPFLWWRIPLASGAIFLSGQEHAVRQLIPRAPCTALLSCPLLG